MDTAVFAPDWFKENKRDEGEKTKNRKFWAISLALHGVLLAVVIRFQSSPVPNIDSPAVPLKATLVFLAQPKQFAESSPEVEQPSSVGESLPAQTTPALSSQTADNPQHAQNRQELIAPVSPPKNSEHIPKARLNLLPASALKGLQSTLHQALLKEANQQRRQLIVSPAIIDARKGKEDIPTIIQTRKINCDKGVNGIIGFVSGIAGGTLECSNRVNDIDKFIDKRQK